MALDLPGISVDISYYGRHLAPQVALATANIPLASGAAAQKVPSSTGWIQGVGSNLSEKVLSERRDSG
jgi:hypothetical protein